MGTPLVSGALGGGTVQPVAGTETPRAEARSGGIMTRARALATWMWDGTSPAETFFGPGVPMPPVAPEETAGRLRDYPLTANMQWAPRAEELTPFQELYQLADTHDITQLCIQTRLDQMAAQEWTIRLRNAPGGKKFGDVQEDLVTFFQSPDRLEPWEQWQGRLLYDHFVGDCTTCYVRRDVKGDVWGFEPIHGGTITLRLDPWGRVPRQGEAYTQIIKGLPAVPYSRDQLIYAPRRPRNHKGYGLSCVEQIIITVNICLRRQFHQLAWYTDGSAPDLIVGVPKEWSAKEVTKLEAYWESLFRGNSAQRRGHPMIVPGGNECKFENTKKDPLKDEFDEWLARVICFCFSLPPTPFVKMMNRGTAETAQETAQKEGLVPLKKWWKSIIDNMLVRMGRADCEFSWENTEALDPLIRAQVNNINLANGTVKRNEVRDTLGMDPLPDDAIPTLPEAQALAALVAAGILDAADAAEKLGLPKPTPKPDPIPPEPAAPGPGTPGAPKPAGGKPAPSSGGRAAEKMAKNRKALPSRNREDLLRMEHAYTMKVAKALNGIQRAVLARLDTEKLAKGDNDSPLVREDDFENLRNLMEAEDLALYQAGVAAAGNVLKAEPDMFKLANERGVAWAKAHAAEQVTLIETTTREGINELVTESMEGGWSNQRLGQELRDAWEFDGARAECIARTETAMADLKGNIEISKEAGIERVQWLTAEADACDQCDALDGTEAPIDGAFPDGTAADDVAHPNCRCDRTAILPTESED